MIDGDLQTTACSLLLVKAGAGRVSRVSLLMLLLPRDTIKVSRSTYFYDMQLYMCKFDDTYILSSFTEKKWMQRKQSWNCRSNNRKLILYKIIQWYLDNIFEVNGIFWQVILS